MGLAVRSSLSMPHLSLCLPCTSTISMTGGRFRKVVRAGAGFDRICEAYERLLELGIHDEALADLLRCAP